MKSSTRLYEVVYAVEASLPREPLGGGSLLVRAGNRRQAKTRSLNWARQYDPHHDPMHQTSIVVLTITRYKGKRNTSDIMCLR
jgi:hypothetical protein